MAKFTGVIHKIKRVPIGFPYWDSCFRNEMINLLFLKSNKRQVYSVQVLTRYNQRGNRY